MRRIYAVFQSVQLFLSLLALLVLLSIAATLIPQGLGETEYALRYGLLGTFLHWAGMTRFYSGPVLLLLLVLMELNLTVCTVPRLVRRLRIPALRGNLSLFGPDVIHLGLIIILAGGFVTAVSREHRQFLVPVGTEVVLGTAPDSPVVEVVASREHRNAQGTVIDWTITLRNQDEEIEFGINKPVRIGRYRVHFFHWGREPYITLRDDDGREQRLFQGEGLQAPSGTAYIFGGLRTNSAGEEPVLQTVNPEGRVTAETLLTPGAYLVQYAYVGLGHEVLNGFSAGINRGFPVILTGLAFLIAGMLIYGIRMWRSHG